MDAAREYTDREIRRVTRDLTVEYGREGDLAASALTEYLEGTLVDGVVPESALQGREWASMRSQLARQMSDRNASAVEAVGGRMSAVRDLTAGDAPARSRVPSPSVNRARDLAWNERHVEAAARAAVGRTPDVAARGMRDLADMNRNGAVRRARTAVNGAENAGRMDAMLARGGSKRWVAVMDERTRASHADLNGEVVPVEDPFSNGLMYPGDPSGPPEEVCNCRCTMEWVDTGGTNGKFELDDQGEAVKWMLEENGIEVNPDNTVTLYHATPPENVESIVENGFRPNMAPINGGDPNNEIGPRVFFGADREWIERTWAGQAGDFEIMEVRVPVEYLQQAGPNKQEIFVEGTLRRRDDGVWIPDTDPSDTAWRRRALKRWIRRKP